MGIEGAGSQSSSMAGYLKPFLGTVKACKTGGSHWTHILADKPYADTSEVSPLVGAIWDSWTEVRKSCSFSVPHSASEAAAITLSGNTSFWKPNVARKCAQASCFRTAARKGVVSMASLWSQAHNSWHSVDFLCSRFSLRQNTARKMLDMVQSSLLPAVAEALSRTHVFQVDDWVLTLPRDQNLHPSTQVTAQGFRQHVVFRVVEVNNDVIRGAEFVLTTDSHSLTATRLEVWLAVNSCQLVTVLCGVGSGRWC